VLFAVSTVWWRIWVITVVMDFRYRTYSPGLGIRILDRWEFGSFGSRFFKGSLNLTNDEISSDDSSWNDRGSGGGRRASTRTVINSTHPGVNQRTKRMFAVGYGLCPLQTKGRPSSSFQVFRLDFDLAKRTVDVETT